MLRQTKKVTKSNEKTAKVTVSPPLVTTDELIEKKKCLRRVSFRRAGDNFQKNVKNRYQYQKVCDRNPNTVAQIIRDSDSLKDLNTGWIKYEIKVSKEFEFYKLLLTQLH